MDKTLKCVIISLIIFGFISTNHVKAFAFEYTFTKTYRSVDDTITGKLNKQLLSQLKKHDIDIDGITSKLKTSKDKVGFLNLVESVYTKSKLSEKGKVVLILSFYPKVLTSDELLTFNVMFEEVEAKEDGLWDEIDIFEKERINGVLEDMDKEIAKQNEEIAKQKALLAKEINTREELKAEIEKVKKEIEQSKKRVEQLMWLHNYLKQLQEKLDAMNKNKE